MGYQVNGIAFRSDITAFAFSENRSYFSISHDKKILVFEAKSTGSQYLPRFQQTASSKVISLWWPKPHELCYYVQGDPEVQRAPIDDPQGIVKNAIEPDTALVLPKLRGQNISEDQIIMVEGLSFAKIILEEIPQPQNIRKLPYELVKEMTISMSIGGAENAVETMLDPNATEEKERILRERCNPLLFLGKLFKDPERLLDLMRCTGTIISGSRAAEYFCPGACVASSDVDFYCPSDTETVAVFTYHLSLMGVEWSTVEPRAEEGEFQDYFAMKLRLLRGTLRHKGQTFDIQCIWSDCQRRTATSIMFQFHSTPVQCFISGFAAVSLYDKYTSVKKAIHWPANDKNTARGQRQRKYHQKGRLSVVAGEVEEYIPEDVDSGNELKIIEKYSGRGFQFVEYFSQGMLAHGNGNEIGCYGGRFRSVGDSGCRRISFEPYIKHSDWHIPFDTYYKALNYISWYETEYKTISTQGILDDDFPYQYNGRTDEGWSGPNQIFDPMESSYAIEMINNGGTAKTPWLGDEVILEDVEKIFYAYRYPC